MRESVLARHFSRFLLRLEVRTSLLLPLRHEIGTNVWRGAISNTVVGGK